METDLFLGKHDDLDGLLREALEHGARLEARDGTLAAGDAGRASDSGAEGGRARRAEHKVVNGIGPPHPNACGRGHLPLTLHARRRNGIGARSGGVGGVSGGSGATRGWLGVGWHAGGPAGRGPGSEDAKCGMAGEGKRKIKDRAEPKRARRWHAAALAAGEGYRARMAELGTGSLDRPNDLARTARVTVVKEKSALFAARLTVARERRPGRQSSSMMDRASRKAPRQANSKTRSACISPITEKTTHRYHCRLFCLLRPPASTSQCRTVPLAQPRALLDTHG